MSYKGIISHVFMKIFYYKAHDLLPVLYRVSEGIAYLFEFGGGSPGELLEKDVLDLLDRPDIPGINGIIYAPYLEHSFFPSVHYE